MLDLNNFKVDNYYTRHKENNKSLVKCRSEHCDKTYLNTHKKVLFRHTLKCLGLNDENNSVNMDSTLSDDQSDIEELPIKKKKKSDNEGADVKQAHSNILKFLLHFNLDIMTIDSDIFREMVSSINVEFELKDTQYLKNVVLKDLNSIINNNKSSEVFLPILVIETYVSNGFAYYISYILTESVIYYYVDHNVIEWEDEDLSKISSFVNKSSKIVKSNWNQKIEFVYYVGDLDLSSVLLEKIIFVPSLIDFFEGSLIFQDRNLLKDDIKKDTIGEALQKILSIGEIKENEDLLRRIPDLFFWGNFLLPAHKGDLIRDKVRFSVFYRNLLKVIPTSAIAPLAKYCELDNFFRETIKDFGDDPYQFWEVVSIEGEKYKVFSEWASKLIKIPAVPNKIGKTRVTQMFNNNNCAYSDLRLLKLKIHLSINT